MTAVRRWIVRSWVLASEVGRRIALVEFEQMRLRTSASQRWLARAGWFAIRAAPAVPCVVWVFVDFSGMSPGTNSENVPTAVWSWWPWSVGDTYDNGAHVVSVGPWCAIGLVASVATLIVVTRAGQRTVTSGSTALRSLAIGALVGCVAAAVGDAQPEEPCNRERARCARWQSIVRSRCLLDQGSRNRDDHLRFHQAEGASAVRDVTKGRKSLGFADRIVL